MRKVLIVIALIPTLAGAAELQGRVVRIADGDTLTVRVDGNDVVVHLDGIDAPELGQPYGKSARRSLAELCRGKAAALLERGKDEAGRLLASVKCGDVDVNSEQVRRGMAWVHLRYLPLGSPLYEFEATARLRGVGLWRGDDPVAPWEWRSRSKAGKP